MIVATLAEEKGLDLAVAIDPRLSSCHVGDEDRLRQILLNLVNNALKFTREGSVTLTLGIPRPDRDRERIAISVTDTGIGIRSGEDRPSLQALQPGRRIDPPGVRRHRPRASRSPSASSISWAARSSSVERALEGLDLLLHPDPRPRRCRDPRRCGAGDAGRTCGRDTSSWPRTCPPTRRSSASSWNRGPQRRHRRRRRFRGQGRTDRRPTTRSSWTFRCRSWTGWRPRPRSAPWLRHAASIPIIALTANVLSDQVKALRAAGMDLHVGKPFRRIDLLETIERACRASIDAGSPTSASAPQPVPAESGRPSEAAPDIGILDDLIGLAGLRSGPRLACRPSRADRRDLSGYGNVSRSRIA